MSSGGTDGKRNIVQKSTKFRILVDFCLKLTQLNFYEAIAPVRKVSNVLRYINLTWSLIGNSSKNQFL